MEILAAVMPIAAFVVLLVVMKRTSAMASSIAFILSVLIGFFVFSAENTVVLQEIIKGTWNAFTIFIVILGAIFIYELLNFAGIFEQIKCKVEQSISDELLRILFIGWTFTSFLQSITGFGVPVAVAAPILVSLGVAPLKSVVICILGHAWGGTFGTLAIAWDSLFLQVPQAVEYQYIAVYTCLLLWVYNLICGLLIGVIVKGRKLTGKDIFAVFVISGVQGGGQLAFSFVSTSTACFVATVCSMGVVLVLDRLFHRRTMQPVQAEKSATLIETAFPFLVLSGLVVVTLFVPPIHTFLTQFVVGIPIATADGGQAIYSPLAVFTNSGTILVVSGLVSVAYYRGKGLLSKADVKASIQRTRIKSMNACIPIWFLIMMSKVMDGTGQIYILADAMGQLVGGFYPLIAPFMGTLGAFICSSNMSSNILLAGFQNRVAVLIGTNPAVILAAQTAGASVGNLTATSNVVLGVTTTGQQGKEGEVMGYMMPIAAISSLGLGLLTMLLS